MEMEKSHPEKTQQPPKNENGPNIFVLVFFLCAFVARGGWVLKTFFEVPDSRGKREPGGLGLSSARLTSVKKNPLV